MSNLANVSNEELMRIAGIGQKTDWIEKADQIGQEEGLPAGIFSKVVQQESSGNPKAISKKGAIGLSQLMPNTAKELGVNPHDPEDNLRGGARYLKKLYDKYQNWGNAFAAYNAGPSAVDKYGGVPPYKETQDYVQKLTSGDMPKDNVASQMSNEELMRIAGIDGEKQSSIQPKQPQKSFWEKAKDVAIGTVETPLSLVTGTLSYPIGKMAEGIGSITNPGEGQQIGQFAQNLFTYKPQSESGKKSSETMATILGLPFRPSEYAKERATKAFGPEIGSMVGTIGEGLTMAFLPFATKLPHKIVSDIANSKIPERLASGSVKMPLSRKWTKARGEEGTSNVNAAVGKMLDENITPTEYGLQRTVTGRRETGRAIEQEAAKTQGVASLDDIVSKGLGNAVEKAVSGENVVAELQTINKWKEAYLESKSTDLTAKQLQGLKTELYDRINFDKTSGIADSLVETMRKGVAHELMKKLEDMNPELKNLNKSDRGWILLNEALERSLARKGNRDIIDLGTKVLLGRESWPLAIINSTIGHPVVKAKLAFALNKARQIKPPKYPIITELLQPGRMIVPREDNRKTIPYFTVTPNQQLRAIKE